MRTTMLTVLLAPVLVCGVMVNGAVAADGTNINAGKEEATAKEAPSTTSAQPKTIPVQLPKSADAAVKKAPKVPSPKAPSKDTKKNVKKQVKALTKKAVAAQPEAAPKAKKKAPPKAPVASQAKAAPPASNPAPSTADELVQDVFEPTQSDILAQEAAMESMTVADRIKARYARYHGGQEAVDPQEYRSQVKRRVLARFAE